MTHVKHMGWELELVAKKIVCALMWAPTDERKTVVDHLAPKKLQEAVRDMLGDAT